MSYTKLTDYAVKDSLPSGDTDKIIRGTELDAEFEAIETDSALKAPLASPTFTGTVNMTGATVTIAEPSATNNPATKNYVDALALGGNVGLVGMGGQVVTGNLTLTSSSDAAISVTPSSAGLYATLPDATTLYESVRNYSIYNAGDYDYGVKDSTGTQLGWVRAKSGAVIGLANNATAAGSWIVGGAEKTGITALLSSTTLSSSVTAQIPIDSTRTFLLLVGTDCYGVVFDSSTATFGSPTLIKAAISGGIANAALSATNQILVFYMLTAGNAEAVTLTISGTSITVNTGTKGTTVLGHTASNAIGYMVSIAGSFVVSYGQSSATSTYAIAIFVTGTTPSFGSEVTILATTSTPSQLYVSGSILRTVTCTASLLTCKPYTLSAGTTLTLGTAVTQTVTSASYRAFVNGNGNLVAQILNTTHSAVIFKLTGTVEAKSAISLGTAPVTGLTNNTDSLVISASKTAFGCFSASGTFKVTLLTDTAGTASVGTELSVTTSANTQCAGLLVASNIARFAVGNSHQVQVDCSGTSPTLSSIQTTLSSTGTAFGSVQNSDSFGVKAAALLINGTSVYGVTGGTITTNDGMFTPANVMKIPPLNIPVVTSAGISGASNNESWIGGNSGSAAYIYKMEAAA